MKIGLVFPSQGEWKPFEEQISIDEKKEILGMEYYSFRLFGHEIRAVICGVCKVNAAIATQSLLNNFEIDLIINCGVCGGIDPNIKLFDVICSDKICYHDVAEEILTKEYPFMKDIYFHADKNMLDIARQIANENALVKIGTSICGEGFVTEDNREDLLKKYNGLSADMESAAIAHVCHVFDIPFMSIRSVTDDASHDGIEFFRENVKKASALASNICIEVIRRMK